PSGRSIQEKGVSPDIVLDDFDPKLLAEAKRKTEYFREKDLKGHMVNTDEEAKEFKQEELDTVMKGGNKKKDAGKSTDKATDKSKDEDDIMAPMKFNPKEDYQVMEAVNYLKSYDIMKKLVVQGRDSKTEPKTVSAKH
ncbi:MAG TPA: hypothetical protein DCS07_01270, partial [Bdellovibrionales bacterium]|nr:hypothetical protein [Bdellovibrionales bacterium]